MLHTEREGLGVTFAGLDETMIIYGQRRYGTFSTSAGEVGTLFFHLYFLPIFPTGGVHLKGPRLLPTALNRKSVALGYVRIWGLLASALLIWRSADALEVDLLAGLAWLIPTLAVALSTSAAWFLFGLRTSRQTVALGLGLPALAILVLTLAPALKAQQRRSASDLRSELAALPPSIAKQLEGRSETDVRAFLSLMNKEKTKGSPADNPFEPTYTKCQLYHEKSACLALGKAAFQSNPSIAGWALSEACEGSVAEGCLQLGLFHEGPQPNASRAQYGFERACLLGSADGCSHQGLAVSQKQPASAVKLFEKACSLGSASGCRRLGESFQRGKGVKKNAARATTALKKACTLGDTAACAG